MQNVQSFVLRCNLDGSVQEVIANSDMRFPAPRPGESFVRMVDAESVAKALHLLEALRAGKVGVRWELNVALEDGVKALHFSGFRDGDSLFIGGAIDAGMDAVLCEDLLRIANEQATALRLSSKQQYEMAIEQLQRADAYRYDELSKLNNELINLQRELLRKNHELEQLSAFKSELLGMAAHDLRTPLSVINLYSQYLLEETEDGIDAGQAELVRVILDASNFMLTLINNLLDLATIDAGRLQLDRQQIDLAQLVTHNCHLNAMLAQRKGVHVRVDIGPALPLAFADPVKIEQVLNNLIANAVKFSPPESTVRVKVRPRGDQLFVTVQDEGQGIPAEQRAKLFRPFARIASRSPRGEKGAGLGLAISRRIVEGHGGQIWLEEEAAGGAAFTFTVPVATDEMAQGRP